MNSSLYQLLASFALGFLVAIFIYYALVRRRIIHFFSTKLRDSKEQFVGLASHYLLTPITIIQTAVSRLQEADASLGTEDRHRLYDAIAMGQQRLWIVAEQLVLVNEIDQNNLVPHLEVTEISDVISGAITSMDVFARPRYISIKFNDTIQQVRQARIDRRRMRQAIMAVLDNAIKFSMDHGSIVVTLSFNQGVLVVTVEDEGVGMPEEVITHLSEKFYRGSSIYNFDYEGLGLGLHIAYSIIRMHQGDMTFASRPKRGTVVTIQFPAL